MELQAIRKGAKGLRRSEGRVVSCQIKASFSKVVNLESGKEIYGIHTEDKVFTPLSVTVDLESFMRLRLKGTGSRVEVDLSHAQLIDCRLQRAREGKTAKWGEDLEGIATVMAKRGSLLEAAMDGLWLSVGSPAPWQSRGRCILENALAFMKEGCPERAAYALSDLSGLGPGLTPAGDDFLLGVLAVCRCWPKEWFGGFTAALKAALEEGEVGTTWLSQALLTHGFDGEFALPIHRLFKAEGGKDLMSAAINVLAWGHTSGSDTMGGVVFMTERALERMHS